MKEMLDEAWPEMIRRPEKEKKGEREKKPSLEKGGHGRAVNQVVDQLEPR